MAQQQSSEESKAQEEHRNQQLLQIVMSHIDANNLYDDLVDYLNSRDEDLLDLDYIRMMEILRETKPELINDIDRDFANLAKVEEAQTHEQEEDQFYTFDIADEQLKKVTRQLIVEVVDGRLFKELDRSSEARQEELRLKYGNEDWKDERAIVFACFLGQRFQSKPVPVSADMEWRHRFLFNIVAEDLRSSIDLDKLRQLNQKIEFVLALINTKTTQRTVIATRQLEWRFVLYTSHPEINVEMGRYGNEDEQAGILRLNVSIFPAISFNHLLPEKKVVDQLKKERAFQDDDIAQFYEYGKKWWNALKTAHPGSEKRVIKVYGENEYGMFIPLPQFVTPLYNLQGIVSAEHAARFVSLIPYRRVTSVRGERRELWNKFHTVLVRRSADIEDHAALLCSLLLGFGLDAYVVIGTSAQGGSAAWVLTKDLIKPGNPQIIFWEPLSGKRCARTDERSKKLFAKIACVFNHESYYANIQEDDYAVSTSFNFKDKMLWVPLAPQELARFHRHPHNYQLTLRQVTLNSFGIEEYVEKKLRTHLHDYRMINGLSPPSFDRRLESIVRPILANYEQTELEGRKISNEYTEAALQHYLPEGSIKKMICLPFTHYNTKLMWEELVKIDKVATGAPKDKKTATASSKNKSQKQQEEDESKVLKLRQDMMYFAIKTILFPYPDNFFVIWASISVRYQGYK